MVKRDVDLLRRRLLTALCAVPLAGCGRIACGPAPAATLPPEGQPTPPEVGDGLLEIDAEPVGSIVMIEGVVVGRVPLKLPVPAGVVRVEIGHTGYVPFKRAYVVGVGGTTRVAARLEQASIPIPGRPFVVDDAGALAVASLTHPVPPAARAFVDAALLEHASIASFARASLELLALGAPLALVREHHEAALDEARHAELCLALAIARGAPPSTAFAAMPVAGPRHASFARFARDLVTEGCVGETLAALDARRRAAGAVDDDVARALHGIADDEERHAALAWRTLRFAVDAGGAPARAAARSALDDALVNVDDDVARALLAPLGRAVLHG